MIYFFFLSFWKVIFFHKHLNYSKLLSGNVYPYISCKLWSKHYLKFPIGGEDADPSVIIISYNNVSICVDCHSCRPLQLSWRTTPDPEARFELPIIGKHLHKNKQTTQFCIKCNKTLSLCLYWSQVKHTGWLLQYPLKCFR